MKSNHLQAVVRHHHAESGHHVQYGQESHHRLQVVEIIFDDHILDASIIVVIITSCCDVAHQPVTIAINCIRGDTVHLVTQPYTQPNINRSSRWYLHAWKRPYLLYPVSQKNVPNICLIDNGAFSSFFMIAAISFTFTLYAWFWRLSISIILISMQDMHKKHSCYLAMTCPQMESVPHTLHGSIVSHVWLVTDCLTFQTFPAVRENDSIPPRNKKQTSNTYTPTLGQQWVKCVDNFHCRIPIRNDRTLKRIKKSKQLSDRSKQLSDRRCNKRWFQYYPPAPKSVCMVVCMRV